jgi:hypothetical protein
MSGNGVSSRSSGDSDSDEELGEHNLGILAVCCALLGRWIATVDLVPCTLAAVVVSPVLSSCNLVTWPINGTTTHGLGAAIVTNSLVPSSQIRFASIGHELACDGRAFFFIEPLSVPVPLGARPGGIELLLALLGP